MRPRFAQWRLFTEREGVGAVRVVIVNKALARGYWAGESPIRQAHRAGHSHRAVPLVTIVIVVPDVRQQGPGALPGPMLSLPPPQSPESSMTLAIPGVH